MLYSIESNKYIEDIPHRKDYNRWRSRISDTEYQAICDELNARISDSKIETSSWIPGSDWTGTVFQPIYSKACHCDEEAAGKFFGLILWDVMMKHEKVWSFGRYALNDIPIKGLTYFQIDKPTL